jgi:hypothetical protein
MNEELPVDNKHDTENGNGHTRRREEWGVAEFVPLPSQPRSRSPWSWLMSTRPVRAVADYTQNDKRPAPLTLGMLVTVAIFLVGQLVAAMYWGGRMSATVEQHEKTLSTAGIANLIAANKAQERELADLRSKYEQQQEYIDVITLYEQKIRELMVSTGRFSSRELPDPPKRPKEN